MRLSQAGNVALSDLVMSILPQGTVRDETSFFLLLGLLIAFIAAAVYLRMRRKRREAQASFDQD